MMDLGLLIVYVMLRMVVVCTLAQGLYGYFHYLACFVSCFAPTTSFVVAVVAAVRGTTLACPARSSFGFTMCSAKNLISHETSYVVAHV
jgi:hypothetical protein